MAKRQFEADDFSFDEILDREMDIMISDAMDDFKDFLLGALSKEGLADRMEKHRDSARANATTELCDEENQKEEECA